MGKTTLIALIQALEGVRLTIELRNETSIDAVIDEVDRDMKYAGCARALPGVCMEGGAQVCTHDTPDPSGCRSLLLTDGDYRPDRVRRRGWLPSRGSGSISSKSVSVCIFGWVCGWMVQGAAWQFTDMYVPGRMVRYVHIPAEINVADALEAHVR